VLSLAVLLCSATSIPAAAPLDTTLNPGTAAEFDAYTRAVEQQLISSSAFKLDADMLGRLQGGEVMVRSGSKNPIEIQDGLIHDWTGTVFFPHTTLPEVIHVLQDFDHHSAIYPEMTRSRLLRKDGNHVSGVWRIERRSGPVHVALDLYDDAEYRQVSPNHWICIAHAKKILQVMDADTAKEKTLPEGQGYGFLWRLYGYWTLEARDGGVLARCRTVSLSRSVPAAVGWIVNPFVKEQPRESLLATLRATRDAVDRRTKTHETASAQGQ
jgi:hypothetical protein